MTRRVDQIEVVNLAVERLVFQRSCLCLDSDSALFFNVHRIKHLSTHLPVLQAAATLDKPVCKRGLAMVDVRNDRKISDVIHQQVRLSAKKVSRKKAGMMQDNKKGAPGGDAP